MKRYHIIFKGRVQGVGFRYTALMIARNHNLTGTVENLYNGDVECYLQGEEKKIDQFIKEINNQRFIRIDTMDNNEVAVKENESSFKII